MASLIVCDRQGGGCFLLGSLSQGGGRADDLGQYPSSGSSVGGIEHHFLDLHPLALVWAGAVTMDPTMGEYQLSFPQSIGLM